MCDIKTGDDGKSRSCDRSRFVSVPAPIETKSEWFGYKYQVTPETSKLLQEAVFKAGGRWGGAAGTTISYLTEVYLEVMGDGNIWRHYTEAYFSDSDLPEKQPPQPVKVEPTKKDFVVSKWYKCICGGAEAIVGRYYMVDRVNISEDMLYIHDTQGRVISGIFAKRFDINSESDCDPNAKKVLDTEVKDVKIGTPKTVLEAVNYVHDIVVTGFTKPVYPDICISGNVTLKGHIHLGNKSGNTATTTVGDTNMSTNTQRKTVTVNLIDRDSALDEKFALVATFGEFTTSKSPEALIRSIIIDPKNKVGELIAQHNEVRVKQTNKEIMERTGNKVTLEPVEESDLYWEIR